MQDTLYISILKSAYNQGIGFEAEVSDCFFDFDLSPTMADLISFNRIDNILDYLKIIQANGHISIVSITDEENKRVINDKKQWIVPFSAKVKITVDGFNLVNEYLVSESTIVNNEASIRNFNAQEISFKSQERAFETQKKSSLTTNILAGLTALFTMVSLGITIYQTEQLSEVNKQLSLLKEQASNLELKLKFQQNKVEINPLDRR